MFPKNEVLNIRSLLNNKLSNLKDELTGLHNTQQKFIFLLKLSLPNRKKMSTESFTMICESSANFSKNQKQMWKWQGNITQDSTSQKIIYNSVKTYDILIK